MAAPAPIAAAAPTVTARDELRRPWYRDKVGASLLGAGVASAALGVGFYVASVSDEAAAESAATYGEYDDLLARAGRRRTVAWVGLAAGGALLGGAAAWYLLRDDDRARDPAPPALAVAVTPTGASVPLPTRV